MQGPHNTQSFGCERPMYRGLVSWSLGDQGPPVYVEIAVLQLLQQRQRIFQDVASVFRQSMIRLSKPLPG